MTCYFKDCTSYKIDSETCDALNIFWVREASREAADMTSSEPIWQQVRDKPNCSEKEQELFLLPDN